MEISNLKTIEVIKGFQGKFFHTNSFTVAFWEIEAGSVLPEHSHIHEQTTQVLEGQLEMTINGVTQILKPGEIYNIAPNIKHNGKALTNCKVTDIFYPVREDYKF